MDALQKEFESRKSEIINGVELFFKANMTITDWDVPEVDDHAAAMQLIALMQEALDKIKVDITSGNYDYY